jgi:hypothetical protein
LIIISSLVQISYFTEWYLWPKISNFYLMWFWVLVSMAGNSCANSGKHLAKNLKQRITVLFDSKYHGIVRRLNTKTPNELWIYKPAINAS